MAKQDFAPASRRDVSRLTEAVEGLSEEVRNMTTRLAESRNPTSASNPQAHSGRVADHEEDYDADAEEEPERLTKHVKHRSAEQNQLAVSTQPPCMA